MIQMVLAKQIAVLTILLNSVFAVFFFETQITCTAKCICNLPDGSDVLMEVMLLEWTVILDNESKITFTE
jgi:hypothetical protein